MEKRCYMCEKTKPIEEFSKRSYRCKPCDAEYSSKRNHYSGKRAEKLRAYMREYHKNPANALKREARYLLHQAIKKGDVEKRKECEISKCNKTENIEAHHPDYSKPYNVQWLCKSHHWYADRNLLDTPLPDVT